MRLEVVEGIPAEQLPLGIAIFALVLLFAGLALWWEVRK